MKHRAIQIKEWSEEKEIVTSKKGVPEGRWVPARAINYKLDRWRDRIKWAWGVLIGRYDALDWEK